MSDLLPCPFCGTDAQIVSDVGRFCVACCGDDCFCCVGEGYDRSAMPEHMFATEEDAAEAWNRRTPALTAALAQARRETWEKAVEICVAVSGKEHRAALNYPAREEGGDGSREDSLNAALAAMDCAAAIRSAAAGEEGK
jgi:hypothetical protein